MKIERIFVDNVTKEGLHSVLYDGEKTNEFYRLIDLWRDTEYVTEYCYRYQDYFKTAYFSDTSIDLEISRILNEARFLYNFLRAFTIDSLAGRSDKLQTIFKPLDNRPVLKIPSLQETKFRYEDKKNFPKSILRLYALRLSENMFIITGGAIKIVKLMSDHPDTNQELMKLRSVYNFLQGEEINNEENLIYYYEQH